MEYTLEFDCVIVGGGAAGLMCAATAGYRGRSVVLIEHANKVGKKILMSGGGRCNFTNLVVEPRHYISGNSHFCKSALSRYTPSDFIDLVNRYGLDWHEKTQGQLFCDHKAKDLLNILLQECEVAGVDIRTNCNVFAVDNSGKGFCLSTSAGEFVCESLVVATGGLSIPTMGATGKGYEIARQFGLQCTPTRASLVPFTLQGKWQQIAAAFAGLSLQVEVNCGDQVFREGLLFTHRGLSGPAILQISNYWTPGEAVRVNFMPDIDVISLLAQWREQGQKAELKNLLSQYLPKRFARVWPGLVATSKPVRHYSEQELVCIAEQLQRWAIIPAGTEGYRTAEVTLGGVDTSEISSKTFEAKRVPDLYFIGEVLDVTGWLGGFNFQWAWSSGYCAGQYI